MCGSVDIYIGTVANKMLIYTSCRYLNMSFDTIRYCNEEMLLERQMFSRSEWKVLIRTRTTYIFKSFRPSKSIKTITLWRVKEIWRTIKEKDARRQMSVEIAFTFLQIVIDRKAGRRKRIPPARSSVEGTISKQVTVITVKAWNLAVSQVLCSN